MHIIWPKINVIRKLYWGAIGKSNKKRRNKIPTFENYLGVTLCHFCDTERSLILRICANF